MGRGKKARIAEWRLEAFHLRLKGLEYREIAQHLSTTPTAAQKLVREQIAIYHPSREQVSEVRSLELGRLDVMTEKLMKRIEADPRDDAAYSLMLKTSERRARIVGLDAPKTSLSAVAIVTDLPSSELKKQAELIMQQNHGLTAAGGRADPQSRSEDGTHLPEIIKD